MMGAITKAKKTARSVAFMLVLLLFLSTPRPSQAFLTEIVVGGELAMSAFSLLGQALPQMMLLTANLLALAESGKTILDTIKRIGAIFSPSHGNGGADTPTPAPGGGSPPTTAPAGGDIPQIPTIPMDSDAKGSSTQAAGGSAGLLESPLKDALELVVATFQQKVDLHTKLTKLPDGPAGKGQFADAYSGLVNANEQAVAGATHFLLDAVRDGNSAVVDGFAKDVRALDAKARPAVLPVLNRVLDKGRTFAALDGENPALFAKLSELHDELVR